MTDTPFTETLRSFSKLCGGGNEDVAAAIDAALAEIDRLTKERAGFQHTLRQANLAIDRLTAPAPPCRWARDESFLDETDKWDTACDRAFAFINGGPRENHYTHCPGCGRPLEIYVNNT